MPFEIVATLSPRMGFASHQNATPLVHDLIIRNRGESRRNLFVVLRADPAFVEPKIWRIDRLDAGEQIRLPDRVVHLEAGLLTDLVEGLRATIRVEIRDGDIEAPLLESATFPVELLPKWHWGGVGAMPELLPAFCMPNDPAVDRILKSASEVLRSAGKECGIDGYEKRSRTRTWEIVSAIWSAVAGLKLSYVLPPASFELDGQRVRPPGTILESRVATCLDSSLLFAAVLEQAGLNPLILLSRGHAFAGVWLQPQEFSQLTVEEALAVRKRVELQELLVFETTLATQSPTPPFSVAVAAANPRMTDEEFRMAIDIRRARMRRIKPLSFSSSPPSETVQVVDTAEALEEAPPLPAFDVVVTEEALTPDDRIDQWQRKLLDLTAKNRLLNLPERSKHVPLLCPEPAELENLLAQGKSISISPFPDLEEGGRDMDLYRQQANNDLRIQYAREALQSQQVLSPLPKKKLQAELVDLYRKANSDIAEGGANTLFLALGFLKWKKAADDPRTFRAPLILLPVTLTRRSALSGVRMSAHEDEPRFNLTLLELLRQDFKLNIPGLDGELPHDVSGIDVQEVWNRVRLAVKEVSGFEVTTDTAIATFSFAKYLMWKDLVDRREQLAANPVVRRLMDPGNEALAIEQCDFPQENELDSIEPAGVFAPLPADSSQLAAVVASGNGCSFVLDGPPGTGKSQTIANMIVHNIALGRRVLFVAEKMAALEVVYRRLEERGLGDFCLEVHSHKASKLDILQQLNRAWEARGDLNMAEWRAETERLRVLRDRLNEVSACLHERHPNGMSVYAAIGRVVRDYQPSMPRLLFEDGVEHSQQVFEAMRRAAHSLGLNYEAFAQAPGEFSVIEESEWSNRWQEGLVTASRSLIERLQTLSDSRDRLLETCQLPLKAETRQHVHDLVQLAKTVLKTYGKDFSFAFSPNVLQRLDAAHRFLDLLGQYRQVESNLSADYPPEAARKVDPDAVESAWAEADARFWFLGAIARKRVARELAESAGVTALPNPPVDAPLFRELKSLLGEMDQLKATLAGIPGFNFLDSNADQIKEAIDLAYQLRAALQAFASTPDQLIDLQDAVRRLVIDAGAMLAPGAGVDLAVQSLERAASSLDAALEEFSALCASDQPGGLRFERLKEVSQTIVENERRLRSWCNWRRVRSEAERLQLGPIVEGVESGSLASTQVEDVFLTTYAKWFAAQVIDKEPLLREFVAVEHADLIRQFRAVDDEVARLTVAYARSVLAANLPDKSDVSRKDGFGILKHELQKKRRHKPLRQLAGEMGEAFGRLAPCMLMSPLSIAQYLPADQQQFDLVIFDEASQIAPWDAVGSIARGRQMVIAGDPRQMPPTNFFQRGDSDADFDGSVEEDLESILDECLAVGIPRHSLSWHYRSKHESLIAFSNCCYYDNKLVTFPSAKTTQSAVSWRRVNGAYAKGKERTNRLEAEAIVAETVSRLLDPSFESQGLSLGIITLNSDQQKLVEDLLDAARQKHPEIERFFDESQSEPVVVKNLETVQGDERDVIFLGIGYGPTEIGAATMSMNFGPLNRDGGERRLNVALTRSRREMLVFTSFDPSMIDLNRTSARAIRDLKQFLEFADRGPHALSEAADRPVDDYDTPFEEAVSRHLQERGWETVPQVGVSRFRVDLGIVHPDRPGDFLVGVECDGPTYYSAATARDRDKIRSAVLEGLGWKLIRVWSTDWFVDPVMEAEKLDRSIRAVLEEDRAKRGDKGHPPVEASLPPEPSEPEDSTGPSESID